MENTKPCLTPAVIGKPLTAEDGEPLRNPSPYRRIIGALQYLTNTRPDIAFIVNRLSQFLQSPTTSHWLGAKRVLCYLKGTRDMGLHINFCDKLDLQSFTDAYYACCLDNRRSIAGYCVYLGDILVSWSSKKQNVVSRSSAESEYRALAQVACELFWIESLLKEISFPLLTTPVTWCDNLSACALAANPVLHAITKHIEVDVHFVRDRVLAK
ncbi:hypothetical protein UlMin_007861 [Ulmus minor]